MTFFIFSSAVFEENVEVLSQHWRRRRAASSVVAGSGENFDIF